jgi:ribosomal protein S18 acetylase RimI-like enzyme
MDPDLHRALDFERRLAGSVCDELIELPWGVAGFSDEVDILWDHNFVRVDSNDGPPATELIAFADRLHRERGRRFRSIPVFDPAAAEQLRPTFDELGWHRDGVIVMVHRRAPDRQQLGVEARECDEDTIRELRDRLRHEQMEYDDDITSEVVEQWGRVDVLARPYAATRWFAAFDEGRPVSLCEVYSDGRTAQIEDVATLEAYRNRGLARANVLAALTAAQRDHDLVFLMADEDDWPQTLYEKLGFVRVGRWDHFALREVS